MGYPCPEKDGGNGQAQAKGERETRDWEMAAHSAPLRAAPLPNPPSCIQVGQLSTSATGSVLHERVLYAEPEGQQVLDVMTCARFHTHLDAAGQLLSLNGARCLKNARQMRRLFAENPEAVTNTVRLAERLEFSLENLGYEFPRYRTPDGENMTECLRRVTLAGARNRYGKLKRKVLCQLKRELDLRLPG